jgi:hypothetical protein
MGERVNKEQGKSNPESKRGMIVIEKEGWPKRKNHSHMINPNTVMGAHEKE